jgi:hypothetical protein
MRPWLRIAARAANAVLPVDRRHYELRVEELIRFHRYARVHIYILPAVPAGTTARLNLPDGTTVPLPIANRRLHSELIHEFLTETSGQPMHEATLTIDLGDGLFSFPPLGSQPPPSPDAWRALTDEFREHCRSLRNSRVLEIGSRVRDDTAVVLRQ